VEGVRDMTTQDQPVIVPQAATQAGEIRARWAWVEATVWNERMLTALEKGVKGGQWFSLIDKVYALPNLRAAFARVKANAGAEGVDRQTIEMFESHLEANLQKLAEELRASLYHPRPVRRAWINKLGKRHEKRPLGIPTIRDRVVQTALRNVLEPIYEKDFAAQSYGFRPGRGCKAALRRVVELLAAGYTWVVDADLKSYFDTIPHAPLLERVREKVSDGRVLELVSAYLQQPVMESHKQWTPQGGTPQGAVLSPLLSNIYLHPLDQHMAREGYEMVRYADDFVILCRNEAAAQRALEQVQQWTASAGLRLHPEKTRIVEASETGGFEFLGYHFTHGQKWPRKKSMQKLKHTLRAKTKRTSGISLNLIIENVNRTMTGWFEYFKHSHRRTFPRLDGWVRMRLRSILRKRRGLKGRGRGRDHQRWPNAFFAKHGLFSLTIAHALACQSSRR
jgi:RNA-directed DNA polymerase